MELATDALEGLDHFQSARVEVDVLPSKAEQFPARLAPQPVALVGFDLKCGVEFTPYAARGKSCWPRWRSTGWIC
ncbi:hypothetical protein [Nonomuraea wenchangensis]|uniref:hypothetical protein n=1 Tax=Nonomuraea wenchangensis TaxID=568860 RepID=UPI0033C6852E